MVSLEKTTPLAALGIGAVLSSVNPKNLAFTISAAVAIAQADLTTAETLVPMAVYVLLASVGVVAPVIWFFVAQERAMESMTEWRTWLTANYATIMAIVLLLFGVKLFAQGLGGLIG
jgi:threonine/homoserine/homoserine lactone efflux protein